MPNKEITSKEALKRLFDHYTCGLPYIANVKLEYKYYKIIEQDLEVLEWLKKSIISKKRIQSLRETANPIYEIILHIPQNILKEVLNND